MSRPPSPATPSTPELLVEVEVLEAWGSTPRAAGTRMRVGSTASQGTIGGGRLEWLAMRHARALIDKYLGANVEPGLVALPALDDEEASLDLPLGPTTQQCCGGYVRLAFHWASDGRSLQDDDWQPRVYLHGMGHVGKAAAAALQPLPFALSTIDQRPAFPADSKDHFQAIAQSPARAWHIVMTHDHALDLDICATVLSRSDAGHIGLIGSQTKRARFFKQLRLRGLDPSPIVCPIGLAGIRGKEPEIIAASLAAELLAVRSAVMLSLQPTARQA